MLVFQSRRLAVGLAFWQCLTPPHYTTRGRACCAQVADRIQQFVEEAGEPRALLAKLSAPGYPLAADPEAAAALADMAVLFDLLGSMGNALDSIRHATVAPRTAQACLRCCCGVFGFAADGTCLTSSHHFVHAPMEHSLLS